MEHIKAPELWIHHQKTIFLAGSIEMGRAEPWQDRVVEMLKDQPVTILNPRRADWDNSWKQSEDDPMFSQQVHWELHGIAEAEVVLFYFDPRTQSPITLMELGYVIGRAWVKNRVLVCCPEGFFRKGNVDIICASHGIPRYDNLESMVLDI